MFLFWGVDISTVCVYVTHTQDITNTKNPISAFRCQIHIFFEMCISVFCSFSHEIEVGNESKRPNLMRSVWLECCVVKFLTHYRVRGLNILSMYANRCAFYPWTHFIFVLSLLLRIGYQEEARSCFTDIFMIVYVCVLGMSEETKKETKEDRKIEDLLHKRPFSLDIFENGLIWNTFNYSLCIK